MSNTSTGAVQNTETAGQLLARLGDDARKWAEEFRVSAIKQGYSDMGKGFLIAWFANAIEHSFDVRSGTGPTVLPDGSAFFVTGTKSGRTSGVNEMAENTNTPTGHLTLLGTSGVLQPTEKLETFPAPKTSKRITMISDEVFARCPVTGQPDFYKVEISYVPAVLAIESKSLKLKLQSFDKEGVFCEKLAEVILNHVVESIYPKSASVTVTQKPRGGISIISESEYVRDDND